MRMEFDSGVGPTCSDIRRENGCKVKVKGING